MAQTTRHKMCILDMCLFQSIFVRLGRTADDGECPANAKQNSKSLRFLLHSKHFVTHELVGKQGKLAAAVVSGDQA